MKTIKFLSLLMFVALSAGFASCSDDDDFEATALIGTWEATHTEGWYKDSQYPDKDETWDGTGKYDMENSLLPSNVEFNADGTGIDIYKYDEDESFKWSLKGNNLVVSYSVNLTLKAKIVNLTENALVVEYSYEGGYERHYEKTTYRKVK